ncbi:hypothetical protein D3C76_218460 [compost metagenome]
MREQPHRFGWRHLALLRWHFRKCWAGTGLETILVLSLLVFVLAAGVFIIRPLHVEVQHLTNLIERTRPESNQNSTSATSSISSLAAFLEFVPPDSDFPEHVEAIHSLAAQMSVSLLQVEYQSAINQNLPINEIGIHMVLAGQPVSLRRYMDGLLLEFPNLAIDNLAYEHQPTTADESDHLTIDARLYFRVSSKVTGR